MQKTYSTVLFKAEILCLLISEFLLKPINELCIKTWLAILKETNEAFFNNKS